VIRRKQHAPAIAADVNVDTTRVAPGHQARTRWRAYAARTVETGESYALTSKLIDVWRTVFPGSIATHVSVAQIVHQHDYNIRRVHFSSLPW
jgi:hypothetical protein